MKKMVYTLLLSLLILNCHAQTAPEIISWVRNLTGAVGYNSIPSNILSVQYDASNVYIAADCIPGYSIGPWNGNPNTPANQNFVYKITRNPVRNTGTRTAIGNGHTGVWSNGVSVFNVSDAQSYNNAGVWNRNAYYWEGSGFDNCLGHPNQSGEYHHHVNPTCLYDDKDSTRHSPIIGYAFDGYPIYGIFAYTNTNGTGAIKRMKSSYVLSTATTRTNGPAVSASYPAGCFMEDYYYQAGYGDLDSLNGRFCVTPEYPSGTYCYFATIDSTSTPTFPYTMYKAYYGTIQSGNIGPTGGHNTAPGTDTTYSAVYVPAITISASSNPICNGTSVTFSATTTNGGPGPTYVWKKNSITVSTSTSYTTSSLSNNDTISCTLTSNAYYLTSNTATSNKIVITTMAPVTPTISINATATTICAGANNTFTATATNAGTSPVYQWNVNGANAGTSSTSFSTSTLTNGATVKCIVTSNATCASPDSAVSNIVTVTVNPSVVPALSITAGSSTICSSSADTFTTTATNGGANPTYQWKVNGINAGTNSPTFVSSSLTNGAVVKCIMTSNAACAVPDSAISNSVTITVASSVTPSVSITSTGNTICTGGTVTFTASPVNGGSSASYQWQVNGSNSGTNSSTFTPVNPQSGDVVKCILTSSLTCASPASATSNTINIFVSGSLTPSVSITSNTTNICSGVIAYFFATGINGGPTPSYQWQVNGNITGGSSATFIGSALHNGDVINCILNSSAACASPATATSNSVTMNVYALPVASITPAGNQTLCTGDSLFLTAGGGTTYSWSNSATGASLWVTQAGTYTVTAIDVNQCSATAGNVTVTLQSATTPVITQAGNALNSSSATTYQWLLNGSLLANDTSQSIQPTQSGSYVVDITDVSGCKASSAAFAFTYTGITESTNKVGARLYPLPNNGTFIVDMPAPDNAKLIIYDLCGKAIYSTYISSPRQTIEATGLTPAMYMVQLINAGQLQAIKMVVE